MKTKNIRLSTAIVIGFSGLLIGCNSKTSSEHQNITSDAASIAKGENIFNQNCSACHSISVDGIGPALGGITADASAEWIMNFIKDPKAVIDGGDSRANVLFEKYKTVMPSFAHYSEEDLNSIIGFLHTQKAPEQTLVTTGDRKPLANPIPEGITMSGLEAGLEFVLQMPSTSVEKPLTRITKIYPHPNTGELYILDLRGKLYRLQNKQPVVYMDMDALIPNFINKPGHATGFGSFAFHPEFESNGLLYTTHTEGPGSAKADFDYADSIRVTLQWVVSEWKTAQPKAFPFKGTRRELFRVNMVNQSHGVQEIVFNPLAKRGSEDYGLLYIGIGDGGSAENRILHLSKGPEQIWSSILRIDPMGRNSANGQYGIPPVNPFAKNVNPKALGEVYAYGFRNPHRISWSRSGQMFASNIGQHNIEELNLIRAGGDYGWPTREGTFVINLMESTRNLFPLSTDKAEDNSIYPLAQYDHDEGNAIIGGYEYKGSALPELQGKYLFGDMVNGRLFYLDIKDVQPGIPAPVREWQISLNGARTSFKALCDDERLSLRFGIDKDGEIYLSTMPDGKIYKIVSAKAF